ncbi:MAG: hypothetical protein Q9227_003475 [Pyrenula ochraceoflavens]
MPSTLEITSSFIEGAPPGELGDVVNDIKALCSDDDPTIIDKLKPAFLKYNEAQLITTKLPGNERPVIISTHNRLPDGRYFDTASDTSFEFDHVTQFTFHPPNNPVSQKPSDPQPYTPSHPHTNLLPSLLTALTTYTRDHYPASSCAVLPSSTSSPDSLTLLIAANKYSPANFWNGRSLSTYTYTPSTKSLTGTVSYTIHYYEDGNVWLTTNKTLPSQTVSGGSSADEGAGAVVDVMAKAEKGYQEEVNRAFVRLNEESFKKLRRQLPVTRQKVEWEKVGGYRLGSDLHGGGKNR